MLPRSKLGVWPHDDAREKRGGLARVGRGLAVDLLIGFATHSIVALSAARSQRDCCRNRASQPLHPDRKQTNRGTPTVR